MTRYPFALGLLSWALGLFCVSSAEAADDSAKGVPEAAKVPFYATRFPRTPSAHEMTELGRSMFFDPGLSASGKQACASCHDPKFAYGPPNARAVQLGGSSGTLPGTRAVPSLRYVQNVPAFTEHYTEDDGNDSEDLGPTGGHTWDGRAQSTHDQARLPLFSPVEMANRDAAAVVAKVEKAAYAARFREVFGAPIFDDRELAFRAVLLALETFQQDAAEFYPYDSKYDAWLRRKAELTPQEQRGLALFNDPAKGNCASCHPSAIIRGAFPGFTDFGFVALGVPRNPEIPANRRRGYYDLGLCGPLRTDLRQRADYCGLFRVPSLRNVAARKVFFHNGRFHRLEDAVRFYVLRDVQPERVYPPGAGGRVAKYDDLPAPYRGNVNTEAPFGGKPGGTPALDEAEIADVVAFLETLTDGYRAP